MRFSFNGFPPEAATSARVGWEGVVMVMAVCLSQVRPRYTRRAMKSESVKVVAPRLERRIEELAAQGKLKKGTGVMPEHLFKEEPPQLPDPFGALAQLLEDRERGW